MYEVKYEVKKRRQEPPAFPHVREVLRVRTMQVHGSWSELARTCSVSRQCLNGRIESASRWPNNHKWWTFVLFLNEELTDYTVPKAANEPHPEREAVPGKLAGQDAVWQMCEKTKGKWLAWRRA